MKFKYFSFFVFTVFEILQCNSQLFDSNNWWDLFTTSTPIAPTSTRDNLVGPTPDYSNACCECVPFYLCGENNTIITDGGNIIGPRFGGSLRITDVETCPDVTELCCGLETAPASCMPTENRITSAADTPCECVHWEFCFEEFRISDGTAPSTFIEGRPLEAHSKCQHSLEVCCAFGPEPSPPEPSTTLQPVAGPCVCVNPWLCGLDGYIVTDDSGTLDAEFLAAAGGPCVPPKVCCTVPPPPTAIGHLSTPVATLPTPYIPVIEDQRCNGIRNSYGIAVRISGFTQGESQFGEFPWTGMILRTYFVAGTPMNAFVGGAILIHPLVLLTAAHKVATETVDSLTVRVGEWDIETDFEPGDHQVRSVDRIILHPRYNNRTMYHDVALVVLTEPAVLQPHIRSICLAASLADVNTAFCVINGWGKDNFDTGSHQTVMKSITLPLVDNGQCQAQLRRTRLGRWFRLHPSFLCAGGERGKDACSSDGGGPLACPKLGSTTGEYLLVGITSWGIGCGEDGVPGVYASTIADNGWISGELLRLLPVHSAVRRQAGTDEATTSAATCDPAVTNCHPLGTSLPTVATSPADVTTAAPTPRPLVAETLTEASVDETRLERRRREQQERRERRRQQRIERRQEANRQRRQRRRNSK